MTYLREALKRKEKELAKIAEKVKRPDQLEVGGSLQISTIRGRYRYYHYSMTEGKMVKKYLSESEQAMAVCMAEQEYYRSFEDELHKQLGMVRKMLKHYEPNGLTGAYERMHPGKQILVKPYIMSNAMYRKIWEKEEFERNSYPFDDREVYTEEGERVRSKSEAHIAERLRYYDVPYRYEAAVQCRGGRAIYPDFTILNVRERKVYYWEHFGLMDDPEYVNHQFMKKLNELREVGIIPGKNLICTFETAAYPFTGRGINELIEEFLL